VGSRDQADRTRHRLAIVDGLIGVIERRAELIEVVSGAPDRTAARNLLMQPPWSLSEVVATHTLDIPVGRMTELGRGDMAAEAAELRQLLGDSQ
jgi:DNA gyrase subunit A